MKSTFDDLLRKGAVKTGRVDVDTGSFPLWYLTEANLRAIETGEIVVCGRDDKGALVVEYADAESKKSSPKTVWSRSAHSASEHGSGLLTRLLPGRVFPYPKSLYAVEDSLRLFVSKNPCAIIVDFFAGSGTTAHAVMRLNKQDGGRRQCISVTNNEVSADEQKGLKEQGLRPGDAKWEQLGICDQITKPRIEAALAGRTPEGTPVTGNYKFTDEFPMADGFEENVEFFTMTYEAPRPIAHHKSFEAIAPLLWLKAGAQGRRIQHAAETYDIADTYAVLFDLDALDGFLSSLAEAETVHMAFIVTDDDLGFQTVCAALPAHVEAVRLYESYLTNFAINTSHG